jgi:hypothetical protein
MKSIRIHSRVAGFVGAIALVLQMSPVIAGGQSPDDNKPVNVTFTKWNSPLISATLFPLLTGVAGGDVVGVYAGEVLFRQTSQAQPGHSRITVIEAMYEVQAEDRSFTALIRGGVSNATGEALLDGVVVAGWRTGAPVHVEFVTIPAAVGCTDVGGPPGKTCWTGTIHVGRAPTAQN